MSALDERPWKPLMLSEKRILFRFCVEKDFSYSFQWTDLTNLYHEELTTEDITMRWLSLNKAVETELDGQIEAIECGLHTPLRVQECDGTIDINFIDAELEVPLKWYFKCQRLKSDSFSTQIVRPILMVMNYQIDVNDELVKIVKAKDAELKLLYEGGATLTRTCVKTKPLNVDEFQISGNQSQPDIIGSLSHEKFNQTLLRCKSQQSNSANVDVRQPKVEENKKESKVTVTKVEKPIQAATPKQNSIQRKRPICQVPVPPKKKLSRDALNKMLKKF